MSKTRPKFHTTTCALHTLRRQKKCLYLPPPSEKEVEGGWEVVEVGGVTRLKPKHFVWVPPIQITMGHYFGLLAERYHRLYVNSTV